MILSKSSQHGICGYKLYKAWEQKHQIPCGDNSHKFYLLPLDWSKLLVDKLSSVTFSHKFGVKGFRLGFDVRGLDCWSVGWFVVSKLNWNPNDFCFYLFSFKIVKFVAVCLLASTVRIKHAMMMIKCCYITLHYHLITQFWWRRLDNYSQGGL